MKLILTRWVLLNKRLFKMPVFILILCSVPLLVLSLNLLTAQSDGFVNITIALENPADETSRTICDRLIDSSDIIHFTVSDSVDEAENSVRYGDVDAAWIISGDIDREIGNFVNERMGKPCVTVLEREDNIALKLCREKLTAALSPELCFELMRSSYERKVSEDYSEAELRVYFDHAFSVDELFEFRRTSGEAADYTDTSYLMLPIRGMLAVAVLLCGFAMAMFWLYDEKRMVFCRISGRTRPLFELGYHLTGIVDIAVVMLICLYAAGLATSFVRELLTLTVYVLNCAVFVMLIRRLLRRIGTVAAVTQLVSILVIVVNSILVNLPMVYPLRVLTPVYYYLQSAYDPMFILYGLLFFTALAAVNLLLYTLSKKAREVN